MDEVAFSRLYSQHYHRVLAYGMRRTAPDVAKDVTDETFLIAWRRRHDLPRSVLPWLLVTARNTLSEHSRRQKRQDALMTALKRYSTETASAAQRVPLWNESRY